MATLETRIKAALSQIGADEKSLRLAKVPAGGSTGQVLTKTSAADHAMSWQTPSGGGGGGGLTHGAVMRRNAILGI